MNKAYGLDRITPFMTRMVCRKHYYECNFGVVGQYWKKNHGMVEVSS